VFRAGRHDDEYDCLSLIGRAIDRLRFQPKFPLIPANAGIQLVGLRYPGLVPAGTARSCVPLSQPCPRARQPAIEITRLGPGVRRDERNGFGRPYSGGQGHYGAL
jgi:hypothetical protein